MFKFLCIYILIVPSVFADLNFSEALQIILEKNAERKKAEIDLKIQDQHLSEAKHRFFPSVGASGSLSRNFDTTNGYVNKQQAGVTSQLNLYKFGADSAQFRDTKIQAVITQWKLTKANLDSELKGALALLEVIELEREFATIKNVVELRNVSIELAKKQFDKGLRPAQDIQKLEVDKLAEEIRLQSTILKLNPARATLQALMASEIAVKTDWPLSEMRLSQIKITSNNTPDRLEKMILESQIASISEKLSKQKTEFFPRLDFNTNYAVVQDRTNDQIDRNWSAAFVLTVPVYDNGKDITKYRDLAYEKQKLEIDLEQLERSFKFETRSTAKNLADSIVAIRISEEANKTSKGLYNYTLQAFQKGVLSANDLSLEQHRTYEAQLNSNRAFANAHRALVRYLEIHGKSLRAEVF